MDLSKAFDTVDHVVFMKKPYHYGVKGRNLLSFKAIWRIVSNYCNLPLKMQDLKIFNKVLERQASTKSLEVMLDENISRKEYIKNSRT